MRGVWDKGYNGSGVVVCVVDDGVEKDHPDLKDNYVSVYCTFAINCMCAISRDDTPHSSF